MLCAKSHVRRLFHQHGSPCSESDGMLSVLQTSDIARGNSQPGIKQKD